MKSLLLLPTLFMLAHGSAVAQNNSPCNQGRAEFPRVDPRNEDAICLPELGRMIGTINKCSVSEHGEEFGRAIAAVGDVSGDRLADFVVAHQRCDTLTNNRFPVELLLYKGVRNGRPNVESGERIGPSEINSITTFLAAGDWDHSGSIDLAVRIRILGDTSYGNNRGYDVGACVIFWNDGSGHFSISDTTHLWGGADAWGGPDNAASADVDSDGLVDLVTWSWAGEGLTAGVGILVPKLLIFRGHEHLKWGHDGIPRTPDWHYWNPGDIVFNKITALDLDGDRIVDIALQEDVSANTGHVTVLYGKPGGGLPDTTDAESISLAISNGKYSVFEDVTGDRIPELVQTSGSEDKIKIFIGLKGQRLKEQYGSGHDAPQPGQPKWWGKPWAELWMPRKINGNWFGDYNQLYDLGDGNLDGIADIWAFSWPYLLMYSTGNYADSLVDGLVDIRPGSEPGTMVQLGNIDGSGANVIAIGYDEIPHNPTSPFPGGIIFVKPSQSVPQYGTPRMLPLGTGLAVVEDYRGSGLQNDLQMHATPNPAQKQVLFQWNTHCSTGRADLSIYDNVGHRIVNFKISASDKSFVWNTADIASGTYFITLTIASHTSTTQVVVR
jgi:hypothetical protein